MCLDQLMAHENIGQAFLLKLYENTVDEDVQDFDKYDIGNGIGLLDKVQTDNLVRELIYRGYVVNAKEKSKVSLSSEGRRKVEIWKTTTEFICLPNAYPRVMILKHISNELKWIQGHIGNPAENGLLGLRCVLYVDAQTTDFISIE